jgi:hypothetical protein
MASIASSRGLIGPNLTCFNPGRDPGGHFGRVLAKHVEATAIT